jgi:hypothetical protein
VEAAVDVDLALEVLDGEGVEKISVYQLKGCAEIIFAEN